MDTLLELNLTLNLIGTIGIIASSVFIIIIKLHLKKREEELNKKLEELMILVDKLIEHTEEIKDKGILLNHVSVLPVLEVK